MAEKYTLNWHTFSEHLQLMFKDLYEEEKHSDVTLVCDDQTQFKAHKIVLRACSPVFKKIIDNNPSENPLIYLRGIQSYEMESILQFMYLGEARFYCGRLRKFLKVAQELEVKEISDGVVLGNEVEKESGEGEYFEEEKYSEVENKSEQEILREETASPAKQPEEPLKMIECPECGAKYRERRSMMRHYRARHQRTKFPCHLCGHQASSSVLLKHHIQTSHQTTYDCDKCDYQATDKKLLVFHKEVMHSEKVLKCDHCDYQTKWSSHLNKHNKKCMKKYFK